MIDVYLKEYYLMKISLKELLNKLQMNQSVFYRYLKEIKLLPRREYYGMIDVGNEELDSKLKDKYAGIVKRCNGKHSSGDYEGMEYISIQEWADFCNANRVTLMNMWNEYLEKDRDPRYSISIDRIDNNNGYLVDNIQFVTHGFNSWKRNIRPIQVKYNESYFYFMSCEEASKYFGIRRQDIGECLRKTEYHNKLFDVVESDIGTVLSKNNFSKIDEYYERRFLNNAVS